MLLYIISNYLLYKRHKNTSTSYIMSANPYSSESYIGPQIKNISSDIINYYLNYITESGFSINTENISIIKRILWETYPQGITFQAWYTFDKGKQSDIDIKKILISAFENIDISSMHIVNENTKETSCK